MPSPQKAAAQGAPSARAHALAVLRIRGAALAVALLPAAVAVVLFAAEATGRTGSAWDGVRWGVTGLAVLTLAIAGLVARVIARARPAVTPTVPLERADAPDLYTLVRDLADRLDVPVPSAIALTPDCDSWLEDRTHPAQGAGGAGADGRGGTPGTPGTPGAAGVRPPDQRGSARPGAGARSGRAAPSGRQRADEAPVLVIGSPFLWWMRIAELRALLAPVVAGTGPSAHPDIAAARRFVRGLDATVAVAERARVPGTRASRGRGRRAVLLFSGRLARLMLRNCGPHAVEMERGVAAAAADRAQHVDRGLRTAAQEQVGLAYAGWDRLLTRVALPAWRTGRWPSRLDAGVVAALTELSRRDRLAEGFASRLGERPACDLLEEPGKVDASVSLLAARLFHGDPHERGAEWAPVDWTAYPEEVVDRIWRTEAARLFEALDTLDASTSPVLAAPVPEGGGGRGTPDGHRPDDGGVPHGMSDPNDPNGPGGPGERAEHGAGHGSRLHPDPGDHGAAPGSDSGGDSGVGPGPTGRDGGAEARPAQRRRSEETFGGATLGRVLERLAGDGHDGETVAARIGAAVAREDAERDTASAALAAGGGESPAPATGGVPSPMGLPLRPPRTGRELMADHVTAAVCCAAVDTAGATPGLDWLDGPALLVDGERVADLAGPVLELVEGADPEPLRDWLTTRGIRADKPIRLV
ncbi:hypothetical protein [Streptomyces sp. JJ36]|uniref:hypothetical protein n=1 Tax=Streptomyces sp. JJ36 TaxID=2736645 RepID=UPI001F2180E3|nr:hypothetical protein [Streptomyces sp. JJ36]MCF6523589.1 hypothetical protein [Streptomyces sp. JJ36]